MLNILLIDDMPQVEAKFKDGLRLIRVPAEVDMRVPIEPLKDNFPFGFDMPDPSELQRYDIAFIDLELDPFKNKNYDYKTGNLEGGSLILPYIREHVPWLPVIGISILFARDPEIIHFWLNVAGCFGFDGLLNRYDFLEEKYTTFLFDQMYAAAKARRLESLVGIPVKRVEEQDIDIGKDAENSLSELSEECIDLVGESFWFAKEIVVEKVFDGFSGAKTFKVTAAGDQYSSVEGSWLVKISKDPVKLHSEVRAHQMMTRRGISHATMIPLLWPNVIARKKLGLIAYKFAEGYRPASTIVTSFDTANQFIKNVEAELSRSYTGTRSKTSILKTIFGELFHDYEYLTETIDKVTSEKIRGIYSALIDDTPNEMLDSGVKHTRCLIHKDLHLDNMMYDDNNLVIIDNARAAEGPVIYDYAKLFLDILIKINKNRDEEGRNLISDNETEDCQTILSNLNKIFNIPSAEVKSVLEIIISLLASRVYTYPDISEDVKKWVEDLL